VFQVDVVISDGSVVTVREVTERDEELIREFLNSLSITTLAYRFLSAGINKEEVVKAMVYTNKGFSLIALRGGKVIGHCSYYITSPKRAEIGIVISDKFQGKGLGTKLLEVLSEIAYRKGIEIFDAYVSTENTQMLKVLRDLGFPMETKIEGEVVKVTFPTSIDQKVIDTFERRDAISAINAMKTFLYPRSIAVIGASRDRNSISGRIFWNIIEGGFKGVVYPVNKNSKVVQSLKTYSSIKEINDDIDIAVIAVPAEEVVNVARQCAEKGVKGIVVISSGFAEIGGEGLKRQEELLNICRLSGMRLIGPNCLGLINTDNKVTLNLQFSPFKANEGNIGFFSQSGALGIALIRFTSSIGLGISSFVSAGNKADISGNDLLNYWENDERTKVILLYLESFGNPRKFVRIAKRVTKKKPVIVVKGGRTSAGLRAAGSHTEAMVSSSNITLDALFKQTGIIRTDNLSEMMDVACLLSSQPRPKGKRVGIITNAGGAGILLVDSLEDLGLEVPELSEETREKLRKFLPKEASIRNPVDMIASAKPEHYYMAVKEVSQDSNVDIIAIIYLPPNEIPPEEVGKEIIKAMRELSERKTTVAIMMTSHTSTNFIRDGDLMIPVYPFPENASKAIYHAVSYSQWLSRPEGKTIKVSANKEEAISIIARKLSRGGGWLSEEEAFSLLRAYSIPIAETYFARDLNELRSLSNSVKGKLAVKCLVSEVIHKSDIGAISLNLDSSNYFEKAKEIYDRLKSKGYEVRGFLVQEMVNDGIEMLVGIVNDNTFGPLVACGFGGIYTEVFKDIDARLIPLTEEDIEEMMNSLKASKILKGARGKKYDIQALKDVIRKVSKMAEDLEEIVELDLNPVIVLEEGAKVVDVKVRVEGVKRVMPIVAKRTVQ